MSCHNGTKIKGKKRSNRLQLRRKQREGLRATRERHSRVVRAVRQAEVVHGQQVLQDVAGQCGGQCSSAGLMG
eukprot:1157710-Pelagomonas_calceolata.AAC.3